MKLTAIFLLVACMNVSANGFSQTITLFEKKASLAKIFLQVERQTGYTFVYRDAALQKAGRININMSGASLEQTLDACLQNQPLTYVIVNKIVVIKEKSVPNKMTDGVIAPVFVTVGGKVNSDKGEPLAGATIMEKGNSDNKTVSKDDGSFTINTLGGDAVLVVSYVGYATKEIAVSKQSFISITLIPTNSNLSDIIVVGYGTQKKANLTGAVSTVNMTETLGDRPVTSTAQVLQGAAPGLQIVTGSGQPGAPSAVNIRGFTSINGGAPLVLVDNVPMEMDDVNPQDIATVTVLKDASASSIYGARAAFGVILITTKIGRRNEPIKFEVSSSIAFTQPSTLPEKPSVLRWLQALKDFGTVSYWSGQDVPTWMDLETKYNADPSQFPKTGIATVNGIQYPLAETNLYKDFMPGGFEQFHNLSFSGGSEKTNFRVSLGYTNQDGIMATDADAYKRYNFNAMLNTSLTSKLKATVNVFYNNANRNTPQNSFQLFYNAISLGPYIPTGYGVTADSTTLPYYTPNNMLRTEPRITTNTDNLRLYGKLEFDLAKGLKLNGEYTFNRNSSEETNILGVNSYIHPSLFSVLTLNPISQYSRSTDATNYNAINLYANYSKNLTAAHHISAVIGTNQEMSDESGFNISRYGIISPATPSINGSVGTINGGDNFNSFAVAGYFGRINYSYKGRYLLEATGRYDGSSRFPPGKRFGFFPSFSTGWNITEEPFMRKLPSVQLLKLRGSYGEIGNQVVLFPGTGTQNYYPYIPASTPTNSAWIDPSTHIVNVTVPAPSLVSASFTWERVQTTNLGLDFGVLDNRLTGSFDAFTRKTLGMLAYGSELPTILGTPAPLQNVADLKDKGWELGINWRDQKGAFKYSFGLNLSNNQAYITKYNNQGGLLNIGGNGVLSNYYVGQRIGDIWGYQTYGFFTVDDFVRGSLNNNLQGGTLSPGIAPYKGVPQNPGDIRYVDLNGDGVIYTGNNTLSNPGDRKIIGNDNRQYQFGLNGSATYRSFTLSFVINGVGKRDLYLNNQVFFPYTNQFMGIFSHQLNYWTATNTNAYYPRYYANATGNTPTSELVQTKYLSNGAYLRVRNISASYSFPEKVTRSLYGGTARVFFSGENLLSLNHLPKGLDPDAVNLGDGGIYPYIKKFSFGLNVSF